MHDCYALRISFNSSYQETYKTWNHVPSFEDIETVLNSTIYSPNKVDSKIVQSLLTNGIVFDKIDGKLRRLAVQKIEIH